MLVFMLFFMLFFTHINYRLRLQLTPDAEASDAQITQLENIEAEIEVSFYPVDIYVHSLVLKACIT